MQKPNQSSGLIAQAWSEIQAAFLPVGYPTSVTPDYLEYAPE